MSAPTTPVYVVDASVAIKWFLPEIHSDAARGLLTRPSRLLAPDLIVPEVGNVLWKRVRAGEMTAEEAHTVYAAFLGAPVELVAASSLAPSAFAIAVQTGRTVYDSLYLGLAVKQNAKLVTADARLYNSLENGPLSGSIVWVENCPNDGYSQCWNSLGSLSGPLVLDGPLLPRAAA